MIARDALQPSRLALSFIVLKDTPRAAASVRSPMSPVMYSFLILIQSAMLSTSSH